MAMNGEPPGARQPLSPPLNEALNDDSLVPLRCS